MREGREPLRTFGDLTQFLSGRDEPEPEVATPPVGEAVPTSPPAGESPGAEPQEAAAAVEADSEPKGIEAPSAGVDAGEASTSEAEEERTSPDGQGSPTAGEQP